jgi:hypothetical protein
MTEGGPSSPEEAPASIAAKLAKRLAGTLHRNGKFINATNVLSHPTKMLHDFTEVCGETYGALPGALFIRSVTSG